MTERRITEATILICKPDVVAAGRVGAVIAKVEERLRLTHIVMRHFDRAAVERFYAVHVGKPYFERHAEFMTSGPSVAAMFEGADAIKTLRELAGATDPTKADELSLRGRFGTELPRNAVHASDSKRAVIAESEVLYDLGSRIRSADCPCIDVVALSDTELWCVNCGAFISGEPLRTGEGPGFVITNPRSIIRTPALKPSHDGPPIDPELL
jgi:nucleoside-diphosphate kinase